jgi:hypothetical protein
VQRLVGKMSWMEEDNLNMCIPGLGENKQRPRQYSTLFYTSSILI